MSNIMKLPSKQADLKRVNYKELSLKAKETYNFQKVSSILAEYGYATNWLNVDFESADFIAVHFNGIDILKIQLKGRLSIEKKYQSKDIYICFPKDKSFKSFYLILHDKLLSITEEATGSKCLKNISWVKNGECHWPSPTEKMKEKLKNYEIFSKY